MKPVKYLLITGALLASASLASAAPAVVATEAVLVGNQASNPGAQAAFATNLVDIPAPSNADLLHAIVGAQVPAPARLNILGGALDVGRYTNGNADNVLDQLPADYPGFGVAAADVFWAFPAPTDIGSVIAYVYNYNNATDGDNRAFPVVSVYTTTDATPTAGGTWDLVIDKAHPDIDTYPTAFPFPGVGSVTVLDSTNNFRGWALAVGDDSSTTLASAVTGIRVQFWCAGFGDQVRHYDNTPSDEAVAAPYIAELDVLAPGAWTPPTPPSSVDSWTLYN